MMRILVTGGAGFIGSHLTERLLDDGHAVRVLDNLSSGHRANLPLHPRLDFREGDIRRTADVEAVMAEVDAVFHLAAVASVQASVDDPVGTNASNLVGTLNLLDAARRRRVQRFIYASSAAVYGNTAERPVQEESMPKPLTPYAADKLAGEHYLAFYSGRYGMRATAFRFFNVYGPRQDPQSPYSGVISIFADRARSGQPLTIYGDGSQTRDFVYVGDLVEVLARALDHDGASGQVLNVGRGTECSLLDLISEIERLIGARVERRHAPPRDGDIRNSCADVRRLRERIGYVPHTPIGAGLRSLLEACPTIYRPLPEPERRSDGVAGGFDGADSLLGG